MALFLSLLPLYLLGNLHCMGMCGPLVFMIGRHRFRYVYFLGRTLSFTLAGLIAGGMGASLNALLQQYHLASMTSFFFGGLIVLIGLCSLLGWNFNLPTGILNRLSAVNQSMTLLMLRDHGWPTFLFGFFTIFLPCGQTLVVFSACALSGDPVIGLGNGFAFALLTSPSLLLAMHAHRLFQRLKPYYNSIMGGSALLVGALALCRGLADLDLIDHFVISSQYHIVLF